MEYAKLYSSTIEREKILKGIAKELKAKLGVNLVSAVAYGSTLCEDFCSTSDFDVLVILREIGIKQLDVMRKIKSLFKTRGHIVDLNVHALSEMPQTRAQAFWHNNRSIYMQKEVQIYGKLIYGKNLFVNSFFEKQDLRLETVRVVNSLLYQARKLLINRELTQEERIRMVKFCIYAVMYTLASKGIFPKTKTEAMRIFSEKYPSLKNPQHFLNLKIKKTNRLNDIDMTHAYNFLLRLDKLVFSEYKNDF